MNNKRLITLGIIFFALSILVKLIFVGIKNIKVDDFQPAAVIFIVDSSASNQADLPKQKEFLRQICAQLDPEDEIKIIKVSQDAYLIYEGSAQNNSVITKTMNAFTKQEGTDTGAAYGDGLKKAFSHALLMQKEGFIPAIVVIGDLESDGVTTKQLNWDTFPQNVQNVKKYTPDITLMFAYAHPKKLDLIKEKLSPIMGEQKLILATEQNVDKAARKFINSLRQ